MSHPSTSKSLNQKSFCLVRAPCIVKNKKANSPSELQLQVGTLVHAKLKAKDDVYATVKIVDMHKKYKISEEDHWFCLVKNLVAVDPDAWPYLEAVPSDAEKVALLIQDGLVEQLVNLKVDSKVYVMNDNEHDSRYHKAIVKYKGKIASKGPGYFFGVKLLVWISFSFLNFA